MSCRRLLALCAAVSLPCLAIVAQDVPPASYTIVDSVRLPAESYVGDPVELRYTLRTPAELAAPATPPNPTWGDVSSIRVVSRGDEYDVRLLVVPYEPGTLTLPPVDLGAIRLEGLSLVVTSVLDEQSELRSIYGPQRLPGTRAALLIAVLVVVIPLAIVLYLIGPGRSLVNAIVERRRARIPYRNLLRTIDRLDASIKRDTAAEFYTSLVYALQDLMTSRLGFECRAATSTELRMYLPALAAQCGADAATAAPLAEILQTADEAKFAHSQIRRKTRTRHLAECRKSVVELEAARRRRRGVKAREGAHVGV